MGKACLKAAVKVAWSLQRLASAWQVKISNHTMILPSQLRPKEATQYAEQIAVEEEEEEPENMLLSRFADKTDLSDWYFILVSSFRFFLLLSMRLFLQKELISK